MANSSPMLLYVEDDPEQRMLLRAILEHAGFQVLTARCALEGLELAARESFDAVIVDYELPEMTGAQLTQEIRGFEPSARIILLSGRSHLPAGELVYVDVHVVKGSLTDKLIEILYSLIHSHELSSASAEGFYYS